MPTSAIILAAGKSTRMKSRRPKPMHEVCGRPMLEHVLRACYEAGVEAVSVVVGHGKEEVMSYFHRDNRITWVEQTEQLGTGHAARMCEKQIKAAGGGDVFILAGDGPLIRAQVLSTLLGAHRDEGADASMATAVLDDPTGYGRVMRDAEGNFIEIIEQNDATEEQKAVREVFPSYYCFKADALLASLARLQNNNAKREYYLTDTYAHVRRAGGKVLAVQAVTQDDVLGVNTREQLAHVDSVMQARIQRDLREAGVTIVNSAQTYIEAGVEVGPETIIQPFTFIGAGAVIGGPLSIGRFARVPRGAIIRRGHVLLGRRQLVSHWAPDKSELRVFAARGNPALAQKICDHLKIPLGKGSTELFPDGEVIVKIEEDVRGRDCYIVQPTSHPVNAYWMELFIWIDCLKRASAERVTAVIPYFGYARQDRKDEGRTPITAKLVANLLERAAADRVVSVDLHAPQVQGFFDIPVDHLNGGPVVAKWFETLNLENTVFVSPDVGNVKRAQKYADLLGGEICIIDKRRKSGSQTEAKNIIGDVRGKTILMVDDMITTAGTVTEACKILRDHGAREIYMAATHAVFAPPAMERLASCDFTRLAVTDTIPLGSRADAIKDRIEVLSVAPLLGEAIERIHRNQSISEMFKGGGRKKKTPPH